MDFTSQMKYQDLGICLRKDPSIQLLLTPVQKSPYNWSILPVSV